MHIQGEEYENESSTNITIYAGAVLHLRPVHQNSMPNKNQS